MNAKIDALSRRVDDNYHSLEKRIDDLEKRTDDKFINMEKRMDNNYHSLEKRIDDNYYSLDARISDLRNGMYLGLVLFGTVVGLPFVNKWREEKQKEKEEQRRPSITLEDVMRLIEENNLKLSGKPQV